MKEAIGILSAIRHNIVIAMIFSMALFSCTTKEPENIKCIIPEKRKPNFSECELLLHGLVRSNNDTFAKTTKYIPKNIDECILKIDSMLNKKIKEYYACLSDTEFTCQQHFNLGLYMRNQWGLWWNSILGKYFNSNGIYHPDDMSGIILSCYHKHLCGAKYNFDDEVNKVILMYKKNAEMQEKIDRSNKIKYDKTKKWVDSLHALVGYDKKVKKLKGFVNDSINFYQIKQVGDTTEYWTEGSESIEFNDMFLKTVHKKEYGVTEFLSFISESGSIYTKTLHVQRFYKKNSCLFFDNDADGFRKIFDPEMLTTKNHKLTWKRKNNSTFNSSTIKNIWIVDNKKYYQVNLYGPFMDTYISVNYYIDQDLNVIFDQRLRDKIFSKVSLIKDEDK